MIINEVNEVACEIIECLRLAQPGRPSSVREENRRKANELFGKIKSNRDRMKMDDSLLAVIGSLV